MKTTLILLSCIVLSIVSINATNDQRWKHEDTCLKPAHRGAHRLFPIDNDDDEKLIVLWGGVDECFDASATNCDNNYRDDLYHYDLDDKNWKLINVTGPKPAGRVFFGGDVWKNNGSIVITGGTDYNVAFNPVVTFDDIWAYNPSIKKWRQIIPLNKGPGRRIGPSVAIYGNDMYLFGGANDSVTGSPRFYSMNDIWKLNLITRVWTEIITGDMPGSPYGAYQSVFKLDKDRKRFILYGGSINPVGAGIQTNSTWFYSIDDQSWTKGPIKYIGRVQCGGEVIDDKFIIAFGDHENVPGQDPACVAIGVSTNQRPTNDVIVLDLNTNSWSKMDIGCADPMKRVASARVGKKMYIWGGFEYQCPRGSPGYPIWNKELISFKFD